MTSSAKKQTFKTPGKKRKRQYGNGALYYDPDRRLWFGRLPLPPGPDGKRRRTRPVSSTDKAVVQDELDKLRDDLKNGIAQVPKQKIRVDDRMRRWADRMQEHWSPNHFRNVHAVINQVVAPSIGHLDFKALGTDNIEYFIDWARKQTKEVKVQHPDGLITIEIEPRWSSRYRQIAYCRIREWLDYELTQRPKLVRENIAALVKRPPAVSEERSHHTEQQARKVLMTALEWGDPLVTLWVGRYVTGLRQGELLGMEEDRIYWDEQEPMWDISWQLQQLKLKPGMKLSDDPDRFIVPETYELRPCYGNLAWVRPKTDTPRVQPIPLEFAVMLKIYLESRIPNSFGLVWVTESSKPIRKEYETDAWQDAQARAEVPIVQGHGTRHTANTLIPIDETTRMQFLGHSTAAANRLYRHADLTRVREGQNALAGMLLPEKIIPESQRRSGGD